MVMVTVADLVFSATEVAVIVADCAELVAAGAVKVAEVVVSLERVPMLVLQITPLLAESCVTVAESVVESLGSTVVAAAVTETLLAGLAHPERPTMAINVTATRPANAVILRVARI
jgi:hypothetical protein